MPMPDDHQRRYSEEEVSAILRLTMDKGEHEAQHDGMSLDELVKVAGEAGFAPDRIRSAAELLDTMDSPTKGIDLFGCRPYTEIVRVVDGEVTDENWGRCRRRDAQCVSGDRPVLRASLAKAASGTRALS